MPVSGCVDGFRQLDIRPSQRMRKRSIHTGKLSPDTDIPALCSKNTYDWQCVAVGMTGFEPAALWPPAKCATKLRYIPLHAGTRLALLTLAHPGRPREPSSARPPNSSRTSAARLVRSLAPLGQAIPDASGPSARLASTRWVTPDRFRNPRHRPA